MAEKEGILSEVHRLPIDWSKDDGFKIDPARPATLKRHYALNSTQEVYDALICFKKYEIVQPAPRIIVEEKSKFLELSSGNIEFDAEKLEQSLQFLRGLFTEGQVALEVEALKFASGEKLLDWIEEMRLQVSQAEVIQ